VAPRAYLLRKHLFQRSLASQLQRYPRAGRRADQNICVPHVNTRLGHSGDESRNPGTRDESAAAQNEGPLSIVQNRISISSENSNLLN
jgi:hypothetical protein